MQRSGPTISIIVPVYHVERYLARCIESILRQTFEDFELVLINDGGTDAESALCEKFARQDSRIVYLRQDNAGISAARNRGLEQSRGEWIMFVDSDDWVSEHFCAKALECVNGAQARMGVFDLLYVENTEVGGEKPEGDWIADDGTAGYVHASSLPCGTYSARDMLEARIKGGLACYIWNKIYHRSLWKDTRFPDGECLEDDAILHELIDSASTVAISHDVLYFKEARDDNITSEAFKTGEDSKWLYIQRRRRYEFVKAHYPDLAPVAEPDMASTTMLYGVYCLNVSHDMRAYEDAKRWARAERLEMRGYPFTSRAALWAYLHCKPLFRIAARIWQKRRNERVLQRR